MPDTLVIIVDWSAAATPRPRRPAPDACWIAYGRRPHDAAERAAPEYFRTRTACLRRLEALLADHDGPSVVGVDFSLGYPRGPEGRPVLPVGRALAQWLSHAIRDESNGANNRFEIAAALNRQIKAELDVAHGPFWACPPSAAGPDLSPTRPTDRPISEWRRIEDLLRGQGHRPHSSWKLYTTGAVGSQTLLGLAAVGRWLEDPALGPRIRLWPFDDGFRKPRAARAIVIAEIWPSLLPLPPAQRGHSPVKDARQVAALRDIALAMPNLWTALRRPPGLSADDVTAAKQEGWLLGLPTPIGRVLPRPDVRP